MKISRDDLRWAASQGLLSEAQSDALWMALEARGAGRPRFDGAHVAYYFGALLVIGAMGWFMTEAWEAFGGAGLCLIAALYAFAFVQAGRHLWDRQGLRVPGGLLYTMAVSMTPLGLYGLQRALGLWPGDDPGTYQGFHVWVKGGWLTMEVGTVLAGLIALRFRRFPFLTAPIAVALWYMSMDLTPMLFGQNDFSWDERRWVSLCFGLVMLLASYGVDLQGRDEDLTFWGYLFGLLAFWGALSSMDSGSELGKLLYCGVNLGLMAASVMLRRKAFIVFGAVGVMGYIAHLAWRVFEDALLFPFALTLLGVGIIYVGTVYQRNQRALEAWVLERLPAGIQAFIPPRARAAR